MTAAPTLAIETRDELVSLLHEAAELEHGLVCSYLFAAFSLKDGTEEGLDEEQARAVARWRELITSVALEEMLHLALVSNLITALGAAPDLRRPAFPQRSRYYPAGLRIELRRFDDATITRFVNIERPEGVAVLDGADDDDEVDAPDLPPGALRTPADDVEEVPAEAYTTVGHLYGAIEEGLVRLVQRRGEAEVFIGPAHAQAGPEHFRFPELVPVTDLASARRALEVLVSQGEGVQGDWSDAHYGRFRAVRRELRAHRAADPSFEPARPVIDNPLPVEEPDCDPDRVVTDATSVAVMQLFDGCYELMTSMLVRYFAHSGETEEALATLAGTAVGVMAAALTPLGRLLTTLPAGEGHGDACAGPSFAFHGAAALMPHRRAAWLVFHERAAELAGFARRLGAEGGPAEVVAVGRELERLAGDLEPHLERLPPLPT